MEAGTYQGKRYYVATVGNWSFVFKSYWMRDMFGITADALAAGRAAGISASYEDWDNLFIDGPYLFQWQARSAMKKLAEQEGDFDDPEIAGQPSDAEAVGPETIEQGDDAVSDAPAPDYSSDDADGYPGDSAGVPATESDSFDVYGKGFGDDWGVDYESVAEAEFVEGDVPEEPLDGYDAGVLVDAAEAQQSDELWSFDEIEQTDELLDSAEIRQPDETQEPDELQQPAEAQQLDESWDSNEIQQSDEFRNLDETQQLDEIQQPDEVHDLVEVQDSTEVQESDGFQDVVDASEAEPPFDEGGAVVLAGSSELQELGESSDDVDAPETVEHADESDLTIRMEPLGFPEEDRLPDEESASETAEHVDESDLTVRMDPIVLPESEELADDAVTSDFTEHVNESDLTIRMEPIGSSRKTGRFNFEQCPDSEEYKESERYADPSDLTMQLQPIVVPNDADRSGGGVQVDDSFVGDARENEGVSVEAPAYNNTFDESIEEPLDGDGDDLVPIGRHGVIRSNNTTS